VHLTPLTGSLSNFAHRTLANTVHFATVDGFIFADKGAKEPYDQDRKLHVKYSDGELGILLIRVGVCAAGVPCRVRVLYCAAQGQDMFYPVAFLAGQEYGDGSTFQQYYIGEKGGFLSSASAKSLVSLKILRPKSFSFGAYEEPFRQHCIAICRSLVTGKVFKAAF
jgi:hypothetical protein